VSGSNVGVCGLGKLAPGAGRVILARRDYSKSRPTVGDVLLVIEVADSSLAYDCGEKAELYAAAGIADYWVVNLPGRCVEVRRDPQGGRYRSQRAFAGGEELRPLAVPEAVLRAGTLWAS